MSVQTNDSSGWVGWVYFAGVLLLVRAFFQGLFGLVALSKDDFYLVTNNNLVAFDYSSWGWMHLVLAVVLLTAGFSVFSGGFWGRAIGVLAASLSMFANLVFMPAYPLWSIIALIIDMFIIYALIVHGSEVRQEP